MSNGSAERARLLRSHRLLALAALADGHTSLDAWRRWSAEFGLEALDAEGYWILPLLFHNLGQVGFQDPERPRLAGVYKQMRLRNAITLPLLRDLLAEFHRAGCDMLPGPLSSLVLKDEGLAIPLDPCELLTPVNAIEAADAILQAQSWIPLRPLPPVQLRPFVASARYRHASAGDAVLFWRPFGLDCVVGEDAGLWQRAADADAAPGTTRLADPVDHLLLTVLTGSQLKTCVMMNRLGLPEGLHRIGKRAKEIGLELGFDERAELQRPGPIAAVPEGLISGSFDLRAALPVADDRAPLRELAARHWNRYRHCPRALRPNGFPRYLSELYRYNWQAAGCLSTAVIAPRRLWDRFIRRAS